MGTDVTSSMRKENCSLLVHDDGRSFTPNDRCSNYLSCVRICTYVLFLMQYLVCEIH